MTNWRVRLATKYFFVTSSAFCLTVQNLCSIIIKDVSGEEWCIEEGVPVDMPIQGEGEVRSSVLCGGRAATVWHLGSYATLDDTWTALESWAKEHGFIVGDGAWEIYWCGPRDEPDSSKWRTQLFLPVEN